MSAAIKRGWRYQAVYEDDAAGRQYSFCEVYFDESDRLDGWTDAGRVPAGETVEELTGSLVMMYVDAYRWGSVAFADLRSGMTFERLMSPAECETIAAFLDQIKRPQ